MEREILFCITAVQMGMVELSVLKQIGKELSEKKISSIRAELIRRASIPHDKVKTIEQAVDITASAHKYNYKNVLANEVIRRLIKEVFGESVDIGPDGGIRPSYTRINIEQGDADIHRITEEAADRYDGIKEVGSGGIGKVILSFDRHIGRNIAIKELLTSTKTHTKGDVGLSTDEARFLREARLTAQLEHPSIVPVYEIGRRKNGAIYYSMKYVKGRTLSEEIRNCKNIGERLRYLSHFVGLCNAIAYAHSKGVIHRDIKPHNVMVGEFGETVVLDWGLARVKDRVESENERFAYQMKLLKDVAAGKTVSGEVMGTPQYMSCEQAWGDVENIDERSDIYSLGAVLYELLTGFPPFEGDSALDIVSSVRAYSLGEHRLTPVKEIEPECPEELAAIAEKALSAKKEKRYQSVVDLVDDVEAYMAGRKVMSHRYSIFTNIKLIFRKSKGTTLAILVFVILSIVSLLSIGHFYNLYKGVRYQRYTDKSLAALSSGDYLSASYYAASAHRFNSSDKRILHLSTFPFSELPYNVTHIHGQKIMAMDISPDSKYLVVGTDSGIINLYNYISLDLVSAVRIRAQITAIIFSPNSERIAVGSADGTVMVYNINPFALTKIIKDFGSPVRAIAFSEGGRYIAISAGFRYSDSSHCSDCAIKLYSVEDYKNLLDLRGHSRAVNGILFTASNRYLISASYDGNLIFWDIFSKKGLKRIPIVSPVADLSPLLKESVLTLAEDGRLISYSRDTPPSIFPFISESHYLLRVISNKDIIITAGGTYREGECRDCNIRIFKDKKLYKIIDGFNYRITAVATTEDGRFLTVSDENGRIYTFKTEGQDREDNNGVLFNAGLKDGVYGFRCIKNKDVCIGIDGEFNLLKITKEKNLILNIAQQIRDTNIHWAYPLSEESMLINYRGKGLFAVDILKDEGFPIISDVHIEHIESTPNNEYIGILDGSKEFHLYQYKDNSITDTGYSKKNITGFSFSPDSRYIVYSRTDRLPSTQEVTNIFIDELLTDSQERLVYRSTEDIPHLFIMDNPFRVALLSTSNNLYIINKAGQFLNKTTIDNTAKIKDVIPITNTPYHLVYYEDKKYISLFDVTFGKIPFFLFGHTDNIIKADVLDDKIISVSRDGTVISYDITKITKWLNNIKTEETEKRIKTYKNLLNKMGLYYLE